MSETPKILIVDDEPRMCDSLEALLSIHGYETKTCNSGKEAIEYLNNNTLDLILLDMVMPDMNGCQIMDHINTQGYDTPVIVITGHGSMQSVIDSLRRRAYDYLKKPFNPDEMLTAVGNAIDYRRLKSENYKLNGELSLSEERHRYLVQNSPDIIYTLDDKGNFTFISNAIEKLLNFEIDQLAGKHYSEIIHEDNLEKAEWFFNERRTDKRAAFGIELQLKIRANGDGAERGKVRYLTIELKATGMYGRSTSTEGKKFLGTHGVARDISERKRLEAQLQQTQKMESIGTLAGGIAHDFNNILTTILGNVSLARMQVPPDGEIFEMLSEAETASLRARTLAKQLLTFAKGGAPVKETASIKDILKESPSFVLRGSKSRCELSIAEDLWPAEVDVGQISQVMNNIVINANQAMPEGGIIQVAAENLIIEDRHGLPVKPGRYIKISITDQG
ncbi:MAG: response regulator, partial [Proteobacteria bacterium]|nr:response regulator [Pseudomonadota bacterium]